MGAAPEGTPREKLAVVIVRSENWEHLEALRGALASAEFDVLVNPDPIPAKAVLAVVDYGVEGGKGIEWLVHLRMTRPDLPVMLLAPKSERVLFTAWGSGAEVLLTVPFDPDELAQFARRVIEDRAGPATAPAVTMP